MSWFSSFFKRQKEPVHGFFQLDFVRTFPHLFWTSGWGHDQEFPNGFRYKVLSVREEPSGDFQIALIRELRDGTKEEMQRFSAPHDKFAASEDLIRMLEQDLAIKFDRVDLSAVRTFEEFQAKSRAIGWEVS
jgi:hypothetical protein